MPARFADERLPRGRHNLSRERVAASQRRRLIAAAAALFAERGYLQTTSRRIAHRAAVSSSAFYEHFDGVPVLLLAAFQLAAGSFAAQIEAACELRSSPQQGIAAAIDAGLDFLSAEPTLAGLLSPDLLAARPEIVGERQVLLGRLGALLGASAMASAGMRERPAVAELLSVAALSTALERTAAAQAPVPLEFGAELTLLLGGATR